MKYYTAAKEIGTIIDEFETLEDAIQAIRNYEKEDISNDCYEENFYEIEMKQLERSVYEENKKYP